ncbi:hypothetical protein C8T65DRAFT_670031 [Cerioporus squamosus]|nr:hypothetical protein C8T65DRAFT_670031 [Cerioporus squamosus]
MTLHDAHARSAIPTLKRKRVATDSGDSAAKKSPKVAGKMAVRAATHCAGEKQTAAKQALRIVTDVEVNSPTLDELLSATDSETDSLFDEPSPRLSTPDIEDIRNILAPMHADDALALNDPTRVLARRTAPAIPGLFFDPALLLPERLGDELMWTCIRTFFRDGAANQVMLFERSSPLSSEDPSPSATPGLPPFLTDLLIMLDDLLRPAVSPEVHDLLFSPSPASHTGPPRARQAIINLYWPGEGISPHVDLVDRYGDGIMGVSLGSGCTMQFVQGDTAVSPRSDETGSESGGPVPEPCALYLPKGSVLVMTEEARYKWTHGIEKQDEDLVEESPGSAHKVLLTRDVRLSITFRWLLPGADVVGSVAP